MRIVLSVLLLATALLAEGACAAAYRIVPEPAWVTKIDVPARAIPSPTASGDAYGALADVQVHRAIDPPEAFYHYAAQAVNELGVPEVSQFAVSFNPAYETLLLHKGTIHRRGTAIPIPIRGHVKLLHREEKLELQLYDGALTAVVVVDDVRPGDVVEWSFTLRGANPVLGSEYATQWETTTMRPLGLLHRRLLWPSARAMRVVSRGSAVQPTVTRRGPILEYGLLIRDVPVIIVEPSIPGWYEALQPIVFNSASSWEDVAHWGTTLFQVPSTQGSQMRARIAEFGRASQIPEERAMAAVRFVQNEIRYLGIEIGENSHRATAPDIVLARRFGDCKDKALLLVTFLRALGFEAHPALVNTQRRDSVVALGPSAMAFNHAIVRARSGGRTYWIDPTDAGQRGDAFARMSPPPFGVALVLSDTTRGLSHIVPDTALALTTIEKKIDASRVDEPATLTVQTDYYGDGAATMRLHARAIGLEELARAYLEYYRLAYPKILALEPVRVEDDEDLNHVRVVEQYSIPDFWQKAEGEVEPYADVSAFEIMNEVPSWRGARRTMPLQLALPRRTIYTASVEMPHDTRSDPEEKRITTPAIVMTTRKGSSGRRFSIYHEFVRSRDHFTAEETTAAVEDFEAMELALATEVGESPSGAGDGAMGFLPWVMALMAAVLTTLLVVRIYHAPTPATIWRHTDYATGSAPWTPDQPIGGWLYLLGFGMVVSPFITLYNAVTSLRSAGELSSLGLTGEHAKLEIIGLIEGVLATALFVCTVGLLTMFVRRRRIFFRFYVGAALFSLLITVFEVVALMMIGPDGGEVAGQVGAFGRGLISFALWSVYFVKSRRAEATFVH